MICISVYMRAKKGSERDLFRALSYLTEESRKEPGCITYLVHRSPEDPLRFFLYEQYRDMAAVDAHRAAAHYKTHALELIPVFLEERSLDIWESVSQASQKTV